MSFQKFYSIWETGLYCQWFFFSVFFFFFLFFWSLLYWRGSDASNLCSRAISESPSKGQWTSRVGLHKDSFLIKQMEQFKQLNNINKFTRIPHHYMHNFVKSKLKWKDASWVCASQPIIYFYDQYGLTQMWVCQWNQR